MSLAKNVKNQGRCTFLFLLYNTFTHSILFLDKYVNTPPSRESRENILSTDMVDKTLLEDKHNQYAFLSKLKN